MWPIPIVFLGNDLAVAKPINERKLISILFEKHNHCFLRNPRLTLVVLILPKVFHDEALDICEAGNFSALKGFVEDLKTRYAESWSSTGPLLPLPYLCIAFPLLKEPHKKGRFINILVKIQLKHVFDISYSLCIWTCCIFYSFSQSLSYLVMFNMMVYRPADMSQTSSYGGKIGKRPPSLFYDTFLPFLDRQ